MNDTILVYVLFAYGLVLFVMGWTIALENGRDNPLPLAGSLWWLAGFGLVHSGVEWLEALDHLRRDGVSLLGIDFLTALILPLLVVSGLMLAMFGASLLARTVSRLHWLVWTPVALLLLWLLAFWLVTGGDWFAGDWTRSGIITARYVIYIPGGLLSAVALLSQRPMLKALGLNSAARDTIGGAIALGLKGVVNGFIVPPASFFPASVINYSWFVNIVGLPAAVFRAVVAVGITFFILRVLHHFEVRRQQEREYVSHQLKRLSTQVLNAQEEERKRIARDLHDDTAQILSSLLLRIKLMDRAKSLEEVRDRSPQIVDLAAQAAEGVRRMARELRPPALEDLGLAAAINWYSEELALARGLSVEVRGSGFSDRLPTQLELGLYRVVQEALTNVAKHSGASSAVVTMERMNGAMRVLIEDDGCGFDVNQITRSRERGLGLFGMRERISLLGGTLLIVSQPQRGTRITLEVPITEKPGGEDYED